MGSPLKLTFRTLFHSAKAILEEPPLEQEDERCTAYFMATTSCVDTYVPVITTSCPLGGPGLPLRSEPQGFGFPAGRTPHDHQAPDLTGLQTMTDGALVPWQGRHEVLMTARAHAAGARVLRRSPVEEPLVPS